MNNKNGRSFVVIMIVIASSALLLRMLMGWFISRNIVLNESNAQSTVKLISAAIENYAKDNQGAYPVKFSLLTESKPPYLDKDYIKQSPIKGYDYDCTRLDATGYSCYAFPARCKLTGMLAFSVTTGSLLISEDCDKKE